MTISHASIPNTLSHNLSSGDASNALDTTRPFCAARIALDTTRPFCAERTSLDTTQPYCPARTALDTTQPYCAVRTALDTTRSFCAERQALDTAQLDSEERVAAVVARNSEESATDALQGPTQQLMEEQYLVEHAAEIRSYLLDLYNVAHSAPVRTALSNRQLAIASGSIAPDNAQPVLKCPAQEAADMAADAENRAVTLLQTARAVFDLNAAIDEVEDFAKAKSKAPKTITTDTITIACAPKAEAGSPQTKARAPRAMASTPHNMSNAPRANACSPIAKASDPKAVATVAEGKASGAKDSFRMVRTSKSKPKSYLAVRKTSKRAAAQFIDEQIALMDKRAMDKCNECVSTSGMELCERQDGDSSMESSAAACAYRSMSDADKSTVAMLMSMSSKAQSARKEDTAHYKALSADLQSSPAQIQTYAEQPRPFVYNSVFGGQVVAYADANAMQGAAAQWAQFDEDCIEEEEEEEEVFGSCDYADTNGADFNMDRSDWGCEDHYDHSDRSDTERSQLASHILKGYMDDVLLEPSSIWSCYDRRIAKECEAHIYECRHDNRMRRDALGDSLYIIDKDNDGSAPTYIWPTGSSRLRDKAQADASDASPYDAVVTAGEATDAVVRASEDSNTCAAEVTADKVAVADSGLLSDAADASTSSVNVQHDAVVLDSTVEDAARAKGVDAVAARQCAQIEAVHGDKTTEQDSAVVMAQSKERAIMQDLVVAEDRATAVDSVAAKAIFGAADSNSRLALDVSIQLPNNGECKLSLEAHIDALAQGAKLMNADECSKLITPESDHEEPTMSLRQALLAEHDSEVNAANADAASTADAASAAETATDVAAVTGADTEASAAEAATGAVAAASAEVAASSVGAEAAALLAKAEAAIAQKQEAQAQKRSNKIKAAMKKVVVKDRHLCPMALRVKEIFADQDSFGTAESYDAVDAMAVKVPFAQRMCPEGYTLEQRSWTEEICAYRGQDIKADGSGGFLKSGLSRRAITMLTNSSAKIFANKDEAFNALLSVLTKPVIELMANRNVSTIALGTDTRVLYKGDDKVITVLPAVEQNNINLLARELVYLNVPERVHDVDISDVVGRVGLGGFYFKCDVPPHSKVPVVTMWRKSFAKLNECTSESNSLCAPIEANSTSLKPEHYASSKALAADNDSVDAFSELSAADAQQEMAELDGAELDSAEHNAAQYSDSSAVRVANAAYPQRAGIAVYPQTALTSQAGSHAHALSHELCTTSSVQMQAHHVLTSCESGDDDTEDVSTRQYSVPSASAPCQTHPNSARSTCPQTQVLSQVQEQTHIRPEPQLHSVACGSSDEIDDERDEWFDAEAIADAQAAAAEAAASSQAAKAAAAQAASAAASAAEGSAVAALSWLGRVPMGPVIEAAQDDPGVYAINDCRFDPQEQARKSISAAELRTMEYCGSDANKSAGTSSIATELGLDLRLSERAWKMMEKIDHKWRTGNYNIESLRMLTFLIGPVILELLANPEVTEIAVNSDRRLFVNTYTQRSVELKNSQSTYMDAMMRLLASMLDITLSPDKHILSGILPIDGSRVECNRPPVVPNPTLVIRKHSACSLTLDRLMDLDMLDLSQYILLEHALKERLSIIVSGETGSGKTTLLSALINQLADIYPRERVICLEDTPELQPQIANCTHAYTSDSTDMSELVRSALRQHPDRIVVGEVRGPEALDLLDALSTGHKGSFSSMHAGSPQEAVKRLGLMISRNPEAPENYNDLIVSALDLIIQMESRPSPHIRCIECITGIDANGITVMPLKSASELKRFQTRPDA